MAQKINIVLFGIGTIGSTLINKVVKNRKALVNEKGVDVRFPVITNSTVAFFEKEGTGYAWEANFIEFAVPFKFEDVVDYVAGAGLENLVAVDASGSIDVIEQYIALFNNGFNVISVNDKIEKLPPGLRKEIIVEAEHAGLLFRYLPPLGSKDKSVNRLLETIVEIAEKNTALAS